MAALGGLLDPSVLADPVRAADVSFDSVLPAKASDASAKVAADRFSDEAVRNSSDAAAAETHTVETPAIVVNSASDQTPPNDTDTRRQQLTLCEFVSMLRSLPLDAAVVNVRTVRTLTPHFAYSDVVHDRASKHYRLGPHVSALSAPPDLLDGYDAVSLSHDVAAAAKDQPRDATAGALAAALGRYLPKHDDDVIYHGMPVVASRSPSASTSVGRCASARTTASRATESARSSRPRAPWRVPTRCRRRLSSNACRARSLGCGMSCSTAFGTVSLPIPNCAPGSLARRPTSIVASLALSGVRAWRRPTSPMASLMSLRPSRVSCLKTSWPDTDGEPRLSLSPPSPKLMRAGALCFPLRLFRARLSVLSLLFFSPMGRKKKRAHRQQQQH